MDEKHVAIAKGWSSTDFAHVGCFRSRNFGHTLGADAIEMLSVSQFGLSSQFLGKFPSRYVEWSHAYHCTISKDPAKSFETVDRSL